ncbi:MAG: FAD-dependent oxidoreductase [Candidatus Schekmanbacteria bacterium]|nr:MAG: FAD-dependent oxidoreductase [Candidatus Schekmanbacteria bacterium]
MKRKNRNSKFFLALCNESVARNITGAWRNVRPVYKEKTAPCRESCPAGENIEGVMSLVSQRKYIDAWNLIREENPFPAVCGRACYHPCESGCNRGFFDEPLSINAIERFVSDMAFQKYGRKRRIVKKGGKKKGRVAVIGAGVAGLTAAYHLARNDIAVTVYDSFKSPGGILRYGIPAYRLPKDILDWEIERIRDNAVDIVCGKRLGKDLSIKGLLNKSDALIIAAGATFSRKLGIEGEEAEGIIDGSKFLKDISLGRMKAPGRKVAVIGGGNTAVDVARSALRLGCEVKMFYRRTRIEMGAFPEEITDAVEEGVDINFLVAPYAFLKGKDNKLEGIRFQRMKLGKPDASGRRRPVPIKGDTFEEDFDCAIVAIGEDIDSSILKPLVDEESFFSSLRYGCITPIERVFTAGDFAGGPRSIVEAIAGGKRAALAVISMINGKSFALDYEKIRIGAQGGISFSNYGNSSEEIIEKLSTIVEYQNLNIDYFMPADPPQIRKADVEKRKKDFSEVVQTLSKREAIAEAERCFNCGRCTDCDNCYKFCPDISVLKRVRKGFTYEIDYDHCKGCSICYSECPRNVIEMVEEVKS